MRLSKSECSSWYKIPIKRKIKKMLKDLAKSEKLSTFATRKNNNNNN